MDVLKKAYHGVFSLQDYLLGTLPEPTNQELSVNQRKGFQVFLSKTVVGLQTSSSLQRRTVPCLRCETDEQTQVVEEVVHELLRSGRGSNILTLGLSRSGPCVGLSFHPDHNYTQLITPHWSKLLQMIGKSFMKDLLLNTSVFTEITSSCYIQLSGVPVHTVLTENSHSHPKSSVNNRKEVTSHHTNHFNSFNLDKAVSAVTLCYDKGLHRKLHKSYPLNSLPASNIGANYLTYQIFQKEKFDKGKVSKKKVKRIPQRLRRSKDLLKKLLINFKKTRLQVYHQKPVVEVDGVQQKMAGPAENIQRLMAPESSAGPSAEVTMETKTTMESRENVTYPFNTEDLSNATFSEEVALRKVETSARIGGKESVNRSKDANEKLVTDNCSESISSVLDGSVELFSSPEGRGGVKECLIQHEMGVVSVSSTESLSETKKKSEIYVECEFVGKHIAMATADKDSQSQHFQKCFVKERYLQQSSHTTSEVDNLGNQEEESGKHLSPIVKTGQEELAKTSNCQDEEVCVRNTSLQQDLKTSGEGALTSSSSENLHHSVKLGRDVVTHLDGEVMKVKISNKKILNRVEEDNERYFDAQENLEGKVDIVEMTGEEGISDTTGLDELLEHNTSPALDGILESCEDVVMNEDEFINEDSRLQSGLDKTGSVDVGHTELLQGNLLESCDDEQMGEENFFCERGRADEDGEVEILSNKRTDSDWEKSMEKDTLPHLNGETFSKEHCSRAGMNSLRMQLKQKLKQKETKRKHSISKGFHSRKYRINGEGERHLCYHGNKRVIKATRRKHRNVADFDNRSLQRGSSVSEKDKRYKKGQDRMKKIPDLSSESSCRPENGTVRCLPSVEVRNDNVSMHINSTDLNISVTQGEVASLASNLHIHEYSGESSVGRHNRNHLHHKAYLGMNTVKWTASKSKQRNWKRGFHSNGNLKSLHGKSRRLLKGRITGRKSRNALSMQFGQDSPLAKGLSGEEVYISLRGLLKKIIPKQLWGSTANQNAFFKYVKLLLKLGRFEKLPLSLMTTSLKFSDCDWTRGTKEDWKNRPKTDRIKRKELMEGLFGWLVTDLVVPIVRMLYYVTETSVSKNELIYYPKELWKKMQEKAIYDYKQSGVVTPVDEDNIKLMIMSQKTLGRSKLRFIPKETGFRPIVKMGKSTLPDKQKFGINLLLRDLQDVLTHLRRVHSQLFASSLLGITSIYPKWKEFTKKRHQERESRPLYFVKVDISKCYDSIPHNKLPEVVAAHLKQQNLAQKYLIRRYTVTSISGLGDVRKKAMRHVTPVEGEHDFGHSFHQILCDLIKDGSHHKSVITNQASFHLETVDSLLSRLRQLINYDIVSIGNQDFLRTKGISQGSVLSSLLCSIFYGNMENHYLTGVDKDGLLMRLIDDFLLVTPHLHCATKFLEVLLSGECAETFGCRVNPQKTLTNFEFIYERQPVQQLQGDWFPWCGFLFNVKTLEVKNDYQRYAATSFRYSMTLSFSSDDTLKMMKLKLIQALHRSKGLVIFIDPSVNSQRVITENIYHLFLLTAFRFHSYHQALPQLLKGSNTTQDLLGIILDIAPSFYFKAKNILQKLPAEEEFPLSLTAVKWLCIKAFDVKLSRHFGVYRRLLLVLRQQRRKLARKLDSLTRHSLSQGSTPDIPTVFNKTRMADSYFAQTYSLLEYYDLCSVLHRADLRTSRMYNRNL